MWIESHQALATHPKVRRLSRLLDISVPTAIGHVHLLWWWALEFAENGDLSAYESCDIADAMLWSGDPTTLVDALVMCGSKSGAGFLDQDERGQLHIHDWAEYTGRVQRLRETARRRMQALRARYANSSRTVPEQTPHGSSTLRGNHDHDHDMTLKPLRGKSAPGGAPPVSSNAAKPKQPRTNNADQSLLMTWYFEINATAPTGYARTKELRGAHELLERCRGDLHEAQRYLRARVQRGKSPLLQFAAQDYSPEFGQNGKDDHDDLASEYGRRLTGAPAPADAVAAVPEVR